MAERPVAERVETMVVAGEAAVERIGDEQGVVKRRNGDPALRERHHVELDVVAELENARRLEERLQERERLRFGDLPFDERAAAEQVVGADAVPDRDVAGFAGPDRDRHADQLAPHRVDGREFRIHRRDALRLRSGDPAGEFRGRPCGRVGRAVNRRARFGRASADEVSGRGLGESWRRGRSLGRRGGRGCFRRRRLGRRAVALEPGRGTGQARIRFDRGRLDAADFGDAAGEGGEFHRFQEAEQTLAVDLRRREGFERRLHRDIAIERDEALRNADPLDILRVGQRLAALGLLDLARPGEQRLEVAVFENELRRSLQADAGRAGHIVGRVAGERLDIDNLVGAHSLEIFDDFLDPDAPLLPGARDPGLARGRIVHRHLRADELHQVLVGRDDQHVGARFARLAGVGRDQVVGLEAILLDRDHAESAHGLAHQGKLRQKVSRRIGAMRLVGRIDLAPEGILGLVEDDREMGRLDSRRAFADELQHFGRKQPDRPDRQPVGAVVVLLILPDRLEIGAEDERRTVDQKHMVAGADRTVGLGHGRHISDAPARRHRPAAAGGVNLASVPFIEQSFFRLHPFRFDPLGRIS